MELTIHRVTKITLGEIKKLGLGATRSIYVENDNGEKLEVSCFGSKEDLEVEVKDIKKV